jgi:hypothetical protein
VLDRDFFRREFPEQLRRFSDERESAPLRVVVTTVGGRHFDIERMTSSDVGATLYTREETLIFVPFGAIEHIQVSVAADRRVGAFEIPSEPEDRD